MKAEEPADAHSCGYRSQAVGPRDSHPPKLDTVAGEEHDERRDERVGERSQWAETSGDRGRQQRRGYSQRRPPPSRGALGGEDPAQSEERGMDRRARRRPAQPVRQALGQVEDRKSTRLNSSHGSISYAVFCLKEK